MTLQTNYYWVIKQGNVGATRTGTLYDANGPFEITGTLTMTVRRRLTGEEAVIVAAACTPDPDQVANTGRFSYTFDSITANIPVAEADNAYDLEFTHTDGPNIDTWPNAGEGDTVYGKLVVNEPL